LALFAIRTLQSRIIHFSERFVSQNFLLLNHALTIQQEIYELVDEWTPERLGALIPSLRRSKQTSHPFPWFLVQMDPGPSSPTRASRPSILPATISLVSLATKLSKCARLRPSGNMVSAPVALLGFMAASVRLFTLNSHDVGRNDWVRFADAHMDLEHDITDFLSTETAILHSQGFLTIPCAISAFTKRGDIIVANRAINFAVQKGFQISCSTVRWFEHNDLKSRKRPAESRKRTTKTPRISHEKVHRHRGRI
jgi:serine palmitoyltransferase